MRSEQLSPATFTEKQGQYLAFIYAYTKVNQRPPAVSDLARYFGVRPPSAQRMVDELARKQLIERLRGQARSIRVLLNPDQLPPLR